MNAGPLVSIVLVTRRPRFLPLILRLINGQDHRPRELVTVLHGLTRGALPAALAGRLAASARCVLELPATVPLGTCLNAGIAEARGAIIAKMDDDDLYGRRYLTEAVEAMRVRAVPVVGKTEHFVHHVPRRELLLWVPGGSWMSQNYLTGGSLVFDAALGRSPGFRALSLSEDSTFAEDCRERGYALFATSRRNYVLRRFGSGHHTWQASEAELARRGVVVRQGLVQNDPDTILRLTGSA